MRELAAGKLRLDLPAPQVARVAIDNPAKRNAMDHDILDALAELLPTLDVRCLVITGSGRTFSAGYDIGDIPESGFPEEAERIVARPFATGIAAVDDFPYPTVAAVNGHAIGGGLELALSCDLRIASSAARLGMPPAKLGLVYSHTGLRKFIDAIGVPRTRELFLVGRYVDAATAGGWGLVNSVVEPNAVQAEALALAREIAGNAPLSLKGNKRVIRELLNAEWGLDPAIERELEQLRRSCFVSEDMREGVRAFEEKRPPRWAGR